MREGSVSAMYVATPAPKSPPHAPYRSYPSPCMSRCHSRATYPRSTPDLRGTRREGVARQRRHDEVEVLRESIDEREHLGEGAGPTVREDQRRLARALVHEVHRDSVDLGREVVVRVEPASCSRQSNAVSPVVGQGAQIVEICSLAPGRPGCRFRPPRGAQPLRRSSRTDSAT